MLDEWFCQLEILLTTAEKTKFIQDWGFTSLSKEEVSTKHFLSEDNNHFLHLIIKVIQQTRKETEAKQKKLHVATETEICCTALS